MAAMELLLFYGASAVLVAGLTLIERRRNSGATDWIINLQSWAVNLAIGASVSHFWPRWVGGSLIEANDLPLWLSLPLFFVVRDFLEWFYHLCQYRIPALWAIHSLHDKANGSAPRLVSSPLARDKLGKPVMQILIGSE